MITFESCLNTMTRPPFPILGLLLGLAILRPALAAPVFEQSSLWTGGREGYHTFRIPSLLVTKEGTVLAFCEGRKTSSGDHGDVDLVMKRSTDGGRSWSPLTMVHEEGGDEKITIGNPCPVVDSETGIIWLPFNRDNKAVFITSSTDDGKTWALPRDISASTVRPEWVWVATGPGIGIQLTKGPHKGRLVIPSDQRLLLPDKQMEWNSHMMYSDDHGATWQISAPIRSGGNECQVIEREDGTLLVNTRMQGNFEGYRGIATSSDGGVTWTDITHEKQIPCPKCQGSLLSYDEHRLLFSNPHPKFGDAVTGRMPRERLTIRLSTDDGLTWPTSRVLNHGPSAYSSLARLPDRAILCLYEGGEKHSSEALRLARFNLDWLLEEGAP